MLWLDCAKKEGLESIKKLYLWLYKFYDDKIEQIENGIKWRNPNIESELIYLNSEDLHEPHTTFYRKLININGEIETAYLQVVAGTFAKTYINDLYISHTITRHSLNYTALENNIQIFNIKEFLRQGNNVIHVENIDYIGGICPINLYGEINMKKNEMLKIITDKTWLATKDLEKEWDNVKSFGSPPKFTGGLCFPDFKNSLHSKEDDTFVIFNTIVSRFSKKFFGLIKLAFRLFQRYDIFE
jgi:hypothetical protein